MLVISVCIIFFIISYKLKSDVEISSGYECGFNLISNARIIFSYRFFLIGILFLIFGVEIVLLLLIPFLIKNLITIIAGVIFVLILIVGFFI